MVIKWYMHYRDIGFRKASSSWSNHWRSFKIIGNAIRLYTGSQKTGYKFTNLKYLLIIFVMLPTMSPHTTNHHHYHRHILDAGRDISIRPDHLFRDGIILCSVILSVDRFNVCPICRQDAECFNYLFCLVRNSTVWQLWLQNCSSWCQAVTVVYWVLSFKVWPNNKMVYLVH